MQKSRCRPVHVEVEARENETSENLIKRFLRKCKKVKLHEIFMEKYPKSAFFVKKSDRTRERNKIALHKARALTEKEK